MESYIFFHVGSWAITQTVVTTWGIMMVLVALAWCSTRRFSRGSSRLQTVVEATVELVDDSVRAVLPNPPEGLVPFIGTLWIFIACANLASLIPGLKSPTGDLSLTAGLAVIVFLSSHWFGIRASGWKMYLRHYLEPNPVMLPFHIISELSRTVSLAVRLFGNIMSLEMAAAMVVLVAGLFVPVPLLMLHVLEALVQAYIFGILALVYIAGNIQSHHNTQAVIHTDHLGKEAS